MKSYDGSMQALLRQFWPRVAWQLCLTGSASRRSPSVLYTAYSWLHDDGAHKVSTGSSVYECNAHGILWLRVGKCSLKTAQRKASQNALTWLRNKARLRWCSPPNEHTH